LYPLVRRLPTIFEWDKFLTFKFSRFFCPSLVFGGIKILLVVVKKKDKKFDFKSKKKKKKSQISFEVYYVFVFSVMFEKKHIHYTYIYALQCVNGETYLVLYKYKMCSDWMCLLLFLLNDYDYYDSLSRGQLALVGELQSSFTFL
jgi:hypothetical protein